MKTPKSRERADESGGSLELHRRTWELELLISGAIVVALLQLPELIDAAWEQFALQASRDLRTLGWYVYFPLKLALTPTIAIFVLHILIRGMWVGLVGLNSVFPDGPRVDRLDFGPIQRDYFGARLDPRRLESALDRVASTMFSVLFSILTLFSALALWITAGMGTVLVVRALGGAESLGTAIQIGYFVPFLLIFLPGGMGAVADRLAARRGWTEGRTVGFARAATAWYWFASLAFLWYPATASLMTNLARRKVEWWRAALVGLPVGLLIPVFVFLPLLGPRLIREFDSWTWAPDDPAEAGVSIVSYDDSRQGRLPRGPVIDSATPAEDWLRIFTPYEARRDNERLAELCPEVDPFRRDGDVVAALRGRSSGTADERRKALECFGKLWTVELDGEVLEGRELLFSDLAVAAGTRSDPGATRLVPGVSTMLDIRVLESGRHDLVLRRQTTEKERASRRFREETHVFHIPFWR